jgi:electron transfer flavoprotein beta subunit
LQTLEPVAGPALKNELMLPHIFDPWAAHALYEAGHLARQAAGSKVYVVSLAPKAKLQQVMMTVAQKLPFELIALDGTGGGFSDSATVAAALAEAIRGIVGLDMSRLLLFGGWESATRGAGVTMQRVGEQLGIGEQFLAVDQLEVQETGALKIWERLEGGRQQISVCAGPPAMLAWATGHLPEPPNHPPTGMANGRLDATIWRSAYRNRSGRPPSSRTSPPPKSRAKSWSGSPNDSRVARNPTDQGRAGMSMLCGQAGRAGDGRLDRRERGCSGRDHWERSIPVLRGRGAGIRRVAVRDGRGGSGSPDSGGGRKARPRTQQPSLAARAPGCGATGGRGD